MCVFSRRPPKCSVSAFRFQPLSEFEPNMMKVKEPVVIIGDIHGQFFDMIHMFEKVIDPRGLPK